MSRGSVAVVDAISAMRTNGQQVSGYLQVLLSAWTRAGIRLRVDVKVDGMYSHRFAQSTQSGGTSWTRIGAQFGLTAIYVCLIISMWGCVRVQRQDIDRATALSQAGSHVAAETSLRDLLKRGSGQALLPDETLLVQSKLIPVLENQGRLGEAVELAQEVHQQWLRRRGERAPNTIAALSNLGRLYAVIGRLEQAVDAQEKSTRMSIEVLGSWHEASVGARNNLAATYLMLGRMHEAVRLQEVALDASRRTLGEKNLQTLTAMSNLSKSYLAARQFDAALASSHKAMQGLQELVGARAPYSLVAVANYVAALEARGESGAALPIQEDLVVASLDSWGGRHRFTLDQMAVLAELYAKADRTGDAIALSGRFIEGAEQVRGQPGLSRDDRRALFSAYADAYRFFSEMHGAKGDIAEGFRLAELSKARTLLESMSEQIASRSNLLAQTDQEKLLSLEQALHEHEKAISEAPDTRARAPLLERRDADLRAYEGLVADLTARYPKFAQLRDPRILSAADLPGLIPRGAAYVGYIVRGDHLSAWLTDVSGALWFRDLGEVVRLTEAVEALRRVSSYLGGFRQLQTEDGLRVWRLADGGFRLLDAKEVPPVGAAVVTQESDLIAYLSDHLLRPLMGSLRGNNHWIISPDGPLAQLPFELLAIDGRRVLDTVDVHYTQSLSVYAMARAQQSEYRNLPRSKDMLALGNPVYETNGESATSRRALLRSLPIYSEQQLKETRLAWISLPGTETEIRTLHKLIPNSDIFLQNEASESTLQQLNRQGDLKKYRYLHFAVHGHLSTENPALSSLVLSQVNIIEGTDGYITAAEWPWYELRSDLTVLSACDTGLGKNISGEGVMGLSFALFVAGNVNTVLSLWPVFDEVAPVFMAEFFSRMIMGQSTAEALAETKRKISKNPKTRHPANWAPFILIGAG